MTTLDHAALFADIRTISRTELARRLTVLVEAPPDSTLAPHLAALLLDFPFDLFTLGPAAAALGAALLHGCEASAFDAKTSRPSPYKVVAIWQEVALDACRAFAVRAENLAGATPTELYPLPKRPRAAAQKAWLELAATRAPAVLPTLLTDLAACPSTDLTRRGLALLGFPRDRRIADAIGLVLASPAVGVRLENPLFFVCGLLMVAHGDSSHAPSLGRLCKALPELAWLSRFVDARPVAAVPAVAAASAVPQDEPSFLRWIAEAPDDDGRRALFSDWLSSHGDVRGEFIALQLAATERALAPAALRRMQTLERSHGAAWLGTLARALERGREVGFERGFAARVALTPQAPSLPRPDDPVIGTLRELWLRGLATPPAFGLIGSPYLSGLRRLSAELSLVEALHPSTKRNLRELATGAESARALERIGALELPALSSLELDHLDVRPDQVLPLVKSLRVRALTLDHSIRPELWLELARTAGLERLTMITLYNGRFEFTLDGAEAHLSLHAPNLSSADYNLVTPLGYLDERDRRDVRLTLGRAESPSTELRGRLAALGVTEIVMPPSPPAAKQRRT